MPLANYIEEQKLSTRVPYMDPEERAQIESAPKVYMWNVSNKAVVDYRGTLGRRIIPACVAGEQVSEPLVIDGWLPETAVDAVEGRTITMKWLKTSGRKVAQDILNEKDYLQRSRADYGVFISEGRYPTPQEIQTARSRLSVLFAAKVKEADDKYQVNGGMEMGDDGKFHSAITADHVEAGKSLGLKRPWMEAEPTQMIPCEGCLEPIRPTAAICVHCDAILDEPRARKLYPHKFPEEKRGPGRPKATE